MPRPPDPGFLERRINRLPGLQRHLDLREGAHFLGQGPEHQRRRLALLTQAVQGARQADHIAGQQRFAQPVQIVTRNVEHRVTHLLKTEFPRGMQQAKLENFLMRSE